MLATMTNEELARFLNDKAGLTGENAVTVNMIRQWVAWDVLPKATPKGRVVGTGPQWSRAETAMRRALRLAELRKWGVTRQTAVIVQAYIEWGHPDFDRVREALGHEAKKAGRQLTRPHITLIGDANYGDLTPTQQGAIAAQIGPLDPRFAGTKFEQSREFYARFAEAARSANDNPDRLGLLLASSFTQMAPDIAAHIPNEMIATLTNSILGMTGEPDEIANSAQSEIAIASESEFRAARKIARRLLRMPSLAKRISANRQLSEVYSELLRQLNSLSPQISKGVWASFLLTQCLLHVRRDNRATEMEDELGNSVN